MSGANIDRIAARSTCPRGCVQVRIVIPPIAPCAPSSARAMCADDSHSTSCPGATSEPTASTLAIEPVGREQRGLVAEQPGDPLLEREDGRVLAVDVVADLGPRHRGAHRVGRPGEGVGAEVDHSDLDRLTKW